MEIPAVWRWSTNHVCSFFLWNWKWLGLYESLFFFLFAYVSSCLPSSVSPSTIIMDHSPAFMVTKFLRKWSRNNWISVESVFQPLNLHTVTSLNVYRLATWPKKESSKFVVFNYKNTFSLYSLHFLFDLFLRWENHYDDV